MGSSSGGTPAVVSVVGAPSVPAAAFGSAAAAFFPPAAFLAAAAGVAAFAEGLAAFLVVGAGAAFLVVAGFAAGFAADFAAGLAAAFLVVSDFLGSAFADTFFVVEAFLVVVAADTTLRPRPSGVEPSASTMTVTPSSWRLRSTAFIRLGTMPAASKASRTSPEVTYPRALP